MLGIWVSFTSQELHVYYLMAYSDITCSVGVMCVLHRRRSLTSGGSVWEEGRSGRSSVLPDSGG